MKKGKGPASDVRKTSKRHAMVSEESGSVKEGKNTRTFPILSRKEKPVAGEGQKVLEAHYSYSGRSRGKLIEHGTRARSSSPLRG